MKPFKLSKYALCYVSVAVALVACGGGGSDAGTTNPNNNSNNNNTVPQEASSIELYSSASSIPTGSGGAPITITAIAKDKGNVAIANFPLTFATEYGSLSPVTTTNDKGIATTELTPPKANNATNRDFEVAATAKGVTQKLKITVKGTTLNLSGDSSLGLSQQGHYSVVARDAAGEAVPNAAISVTSSQGGTVALASQTTDNNGKLEFSYMSKTAGTDVLTVTGLNASSQLNVVVGSASFEFVGGNVAYWGLSRANLVQVRVKGSQGAAVGAGVPVRLSTTRGCFVSDSTATSCGQGDSLTVDLVTNASGLVEAWVLSMNSGMATLKAETQSGVQGTGTMTGHFVATVPDRLILQANPNAIRPSTESSGNSSVIEALVLDAKGNPVVNQTVYFSVLEDVSGGRLASTSVQTNAQGRALNTYYAGPRGTGSDQVKIRATLGGAYSRILGDVSLTVGGSGLTIALGESSKIESVNGDTQYRKLHTVYVTNSAGVAQVSLPVTVRVEPFGYATGDRKWNGKVWVTDPTSENRNEDTNFNGIRDANEQLGATCAVSGLKPGFVATLVPAKADGSVTDSGGSTITLTTDSSGFAYYYMQYAKNYGHWAAMRVVATAQVGGTESRNATPGEYLPVLVSDINKETVSPPGLTSPYGLASCP